jgi:hypothetical protein
MMISRGVREGGAEMEKEKKSSLRERKAYCITYFIGE